MTGNVTIARASQALRDFLANEHGAITVDWMVITTAAISLSLGTSALLRDHSAFVARNMDNELRDGDISDGWPAYTYDHFAPLITAGYLTTEEASALHDQSFDQMNFQINSALHSGIEAMEAGNLTAEELSELISVASIAWHRDLADEAMLDYYFGFDGSTPYYVTQTQASASTGD
ncbi:hypothetical protein HKCCE4037_16950 [Rhodobacterales bacterium HKCCE4037]|nr:hypothetical protein [Rhodobacterales bacterium HKCCE4037]